LSATISAWEDTAIKIDTSAKCRSKYYKTRNQK